MDDARPDEPGTITNVPGPLSNTHLLSADEFFVTWSTASPHLVVNSTYCGGGQSFTIINADHPGALDDGDHVAFETTGNKYFTVTSSGGVDSTATAITPSETFTIHKVGDNDGNTVVAGDNIALQAASGMYCSAAVDGGLATSLMVCDSAAIGRSQTFQYQQGYNVLAKVESTHAATSLIGAAGTAGPFSLADLDGSLVTDGDHIQLAAATGDFLYASCGGGSAANDASCGKVTTIVAAPFAQRWETFRIHKLGGADGGQTIAPGDEIALGSATGFYCSAAAGGALTCDATAVGATESFYFDSKTAPKAAMTYHYTLAEAAHTSAGVFDGTGALIRTLWSNEAQTAGTYSYAWDGHDDAGSAAPATGTYEIKVLHDNVSYSWDGVIGNTEEVWSEQQVGGWDGMGYTPQQVRLAFVGSDAWVAGGYSEGTINLFTFPTATPNVTHLVNPLYKSQNVEFNDIDTDGQFFYLANAKVWSGGNFVTKFDLTGAPAAFTTGTAVTTPMSWATIPMNGIDVGAADAPEAIAVQTAGSILAVAYPTANVVKLFDKTTGAPLASSISVPAPGSIAFDDQNGLYVLSGGQVLLYGAATLGTTNAMTATVPGLSNAVFVATNKANHHVFVADGGSAQQIIELDPAFKVVRTYGDRGGYTDLDPTITSSRLMLDNTATQGVGTSNLSWLRVSPENELWICDGGNAHRILHISADNKYIDQILFGMEQYSVGISQSDPTRVFRYLIEYKIDYSQPLALGDPDPARGGNGAWAMVRNWAVGAQGANGSPPDTLAARADFNYVETLSNGRTYGQVYNGGSQVVSEVELPATGPLRFTGQVAGQLQTDGSLIGFTETTKTLSLTRAALTGFDAAGNPQRAAPAPVIAVDYDIATQTKPGGGWGMSASWQPTTSGVYPVFDSQPTTTIGYPHLAGAIAGRSSYLFETHREGCLVVPDGRGTFPCGDGYGGHNGITSQAIGDNIFAAYDGQYATWGNTYVHYWTDGLMVGQYGGSLAGNIAQVRFAQVGATIYMYLSTEAGFNPLQRWSITGLDSIGELTASGKLGATLTLN